MAKKEKEPKGKMEVYANLASPPPDALKPIEYGALKGKSDINPQWRYEAMTQEFGVCGVGWKFEVVEHETVPIVETREMMVFVRVNLYVKIDDEWSAPIAGYGGDYLIKKDKNGIHGNDEAMKMATTDALGTAMKMIGVAANIYRGKLNGASDSKYARRDMAQANTAGMQNSINLSKEIAAEAFKDGLTAQDLTDIVKHHFKKRNALDCTESELRDLKANYKKYWREFLDEQDAGDRV